MSTAEQTTRPTSGLYRFTVGYRWHDSGITGEQTVTAHDRDEAATLVIGDSPRRSAETVIRGENVSPYVGQPATILLVEDTSPGVVVRVNAKSVSVKRVPYDENTRRRVNDEAEPLPAFEYDGLTDQPYGSSERYTMVRPGVFRNGSIGLRLGRSVRRIDYRA